MQLSRGLHCSVRDCDTRSGSPVARPGLSSSCHHVNSTNSSRSFPVARPHLSQMAPSPTAAPSPSSPDQQQPGLLRWFLRWSVLSRSSANGGTGADSSTSPQGPSGRQQQQQQVRAAAAIGASSSSRPAPTHLIIMVNGLFGSAANWDVIAEQLQQQLPPDTLLHPSRVNARFSTYQGIDTCGQRLADEVRGVVAAHPSLTRLSVVAHSMGGLMARYAIGALYNPDKGLVCGLSPTHFVSMATPHCGCDADGVAQVPFIGWTGDIPLLGQQLYRFLQGISGSTASLIFQRTGQQFFLLDGTLSPSSFSPAAAAAAGGDRAAAARAAAAAGTSSSGGSSGGGGSGGGSSSGQLPLLLQMSQDCPERGLFFYSALAAFQTRTAYANMDGDHLVGFANSSLRSFDQLPPPPPQVATAKGVVLQDELSAAFWPQDWQQLQQQWGSSSSAVQAAAAADAAAAVQAALQKPHTPSHDWTHARQQQQQQQQELTAVRSSSTNSSSSDSSRWRILNSVGGLGLGRSTKQQQQQQQQEDHAGSALAALELEAGGATPAATAAVAAAGAMQPPSPAAASAAVGTSDTAASSSRSSTSRSKLLPLSYSRFRGQPGRGGAPLKTAAESAVAAAAPAAAAAAAVIDSTEEMIELQYSSPEPSSLDATQQSMSSLDYDSPSKPRQQQQQQQQQPSPAAIAASGAAAMASAEADLTSGLSGQGSGPVAVADSPAEAAADVAADAAALTAGGMGGAAGSRAHVVAHMLRRLQELPWRRIDVSFQGAKFGFAHNNIQVTRRWWNFEGVAVPAHLAQQLQLMDALVVGPPSTQQQQQQQQ